MKKSRAGKRSGYVSSKMVDYDCVEVIEVLDSWSNAAVSVRFAVFGNCLSAEEKIRSPTFI